MAGRAWITSHWGLACEELEVVDSTLRVVISVHVGLNSLGLFQWASEEQKQRFLAPQARGEKIACFGLTESGAGSDVANIQSTARRQGNEYILNGEKMWISLATKAQHCLWIGRTNPAAQEPHEGLSAFLVELDRPGREGWRPAWKIGHAGRLDRLDRHARRARARGKPDR